VVNGHDGFREGTKERVVRSQACSSIYLNCDEADINLYTDRAEDSPWSKLELSKSYYDSHDRPKYPACR
jgi:hypothetical protein